MNVTLPRSFAEGVDWRKCKVITARRLTPLASQFAVHIQVRPDWYNIYSADFELTYCPHLETYLNGVHRTDEELCMWCNGNLDAWYQLKTDALVVCSWVRLCCACGWNEKKSQMPCRCLHVWPKKLILIEDKVKAAGVASDVDVAAQNTTNLLWLVNEFLCYNQVLISSSSWTKP